MASELHVDAIKHSGGTSALTISSNGGVHTLGGTVQTIINSPDCGSGAHNVTSWTEVNSQMRTSITPKFTNSLIFIQFNVLVGCNNGTTMRHWKIGDYTNSTDVDLGHSAPSSRTNMHASARQRDHDANDADLMTITAHEVSGDLNARSYTLYCKNEAGHSADLYHHHTATASAAIGYVKPMVIIKEVAQ